RNPMKVIMSTILVLLGCVFLHPAFAQPSQAPSVDASAADAINQVSRDWADADMASDADKLSQLIADEGEAGYPGKIYTKANLLDDVRAGRHKLLSCEFGPQDVKVFGNVAVLQGTVTERRIGRDGIIHAAYMDVFEKRGSRWVVVRSLSQTF